ncbi:hypothetical protein BC628DRAFT_1370188 [Trametes gibbosa]|nr:hypothetical protein BC628DRAFT_1370188 [Trametes gibbosa]
MMARATPCSGSGSAVAARRRCSWIGGPSASPGSVLACILGPLKFGGGFVTDNSTGATPAAFAAHPVQRGLASYGGTADIILMATTSMHRNRSETRRAVQCCWAAAGVTSRGQLVRRRVIDECPSAVFKSLKTPTYQHHRVRRCPVRDVETGACIHPDDPTVPPSVRRELPLDRPPPHRPANDLEKSQPRRLPPGADPRERALVLCGCRLETPTTRHH